MDQKRIIDEFKELVSIEVHSRDERAIADVLKEKLTALGLTVTEARQARCSAAIRAISMHSFPEARTASRSFSPRIWTVWEITGISFLS